MGGSNGMGHQPGRSGEIANQIEAELRSKPGSTLSAPEFAELTGLPLSLVAYAFRRLADEGRIEAVEDVPGEGTSTRIYRAAWEPDSG